MLTEFGKFCRKLRIDHNETQQDIANYLGVTTAYLSTVEHGKRNISEKIVDKLISRYNLSGAKLNQFKSTITNSISFIKIHLHKMNSLDRELILKIYYNLNELNDKDKQELINIIDTRLDAKLR